MTAGDEQIFIDPFLSDNPTTPEHLKHVDEADTILLTHGHSDHLGDTVEIAQATGATVVSNFEIYSYLQSVGVENGAPIQKGGSAQFGSVKVTATHAFHSSSIQTEDGSVIYGGEPMGFVVEFEGGFSLYHAGDTALFGDMQLIKELYSPKLALLPIGDRLTMGPLEAAHAAKLLGVEHAVPIHYVPARLPILTGTPEEFQKQLDEVAPNVTMHLMQPGDDLSG